MNWTYLLNNCPSDSPKEIGGKGAALKKLLDGGFTVPKTACLPCAAYEEFVRANRLREKILLELNRKNFKEMRWEEIWDAALSIRNLFLTAPIPEHILTRLQEFLSEQFHDTPIVIRSSAPTEDTASASFAGLHESFVNIREIEAVLESIKKVWASLWSDRALLYRQELDLEVESSTMAVVIQELIDADCSGILFTASPDKQSELVVEAVHGLNQGLVDGDVEPDRWFLSRDNLTIVSHSLPSRRDRTAVASTQGVILQTTASETARSAPIDETLLVEIAQTGLQMENYFGRKLDIEWSVKDGRLFILQARPITARLASSAEDLRSWYLSLHRSYANLCDLRHKIEMHLLPGMDREAEELAKKDLASLTDDELAVELERRESITEKWKQAYRAECIPFAHGVRLFGEIYNDVMKPDDPYEFVLLLAGQNMLSTARNTMLADLAAIIKADQQLAEHLRTRDFAAITNTPFLQGVDEFIKHFTPFSFMTPSASDPATPPLESLSAILLEYSLLAPGEEHPFSAQTERKKLFLEKLTKTSFPVSGGDLLELAKASYRLRDDDNIHLGKIEQQFLLAVNEGKRRLIKLGMLTGDNYEVPEIIQGLRGVMAVKHKTDEKMTQQKTELFENLCARQLTGQPASRGLARGSAHVIRDDSELARFKKGEVLIVDAIDPNMTFLAPLSAAIVERRGGMLIHGAIIAREYGIPCVTGVPDLLRFIETGDRVTVDGFLGIVTIERC